MLYRSSIHKLRGQFKIQRTGQIRKQVEQVNRGRTDSARAAVKERTLAGLQASALEDVGPDREEGLRDRGRGHEIDRRRYT